MTMRGAVALVALGLAMAVGCGSDDGPTSTGGGGTGGSGGEGGGSCNPATCPDDEATECRTPACMGEACGYMDLAEGTSCSLGVCNPVGDCVECNVAEDCPTANAMCAGNECMANPCMNGEVDGDESDVDCGGPLCDPCVDGDDCNSASDCASNLCNGGVCQACTGGDCAMGSYCDAGTCVTQKMPGEACAGVNECLSGFCADGLCCDTACDTTCAACDSAGTEGACTPHADGTDPESECGADSCNGAGLCRCTDGTTNGMETDQDCGGGICATCPDGSACLASTDCSSNLCDGNNVCAGECNNLQLDPGETAVDCGGPNCPACPDLSACLVPGDCQSGVCTGNVCQVPTCSDNVQNGGESDTDCGMVCPGQLCVNPQSCGQPTDCQSGVCSGNVCQLPTCVDTVMNGQETGPDCGGPTCPGCAAGIGCLQPSDCVSGSCVGNVCQCSPSLNVLDDGSGANGATGLPSLVMSEISPGSYIELFNTTGSPINLGASLMQLCSPFAYAALSALAPGTTVPAGGYATIPWPMNFTDVDAGGEVILYANGAFSNGTAILDFVCWGVNPHGSRKPLAESVGKWSGVCDSALSNGALHRTVSTTGTTTADYDTAAPESPMNCSP